MAEPCPVKLGIKIRCLQHKMKKTRVNGIRRGMQSKGVSGARQLHFTIFDEEYRAKERRVPEENIQRSSIAWAGDIL